METKEKAKTEHSKDPRKRAMDEKAFSEKMVRIMSEDIEGGMKVYPALTKITGVS